MKRKLWLTLGTLLVLLGILLVASLAQGVSKEVRGENLPYYGVSGPVEQGDTGFYRSANVPNGETGISGPVEQGDTGFYRSANVLIGETGISGPIEQGNAGGE